jgi:hypothetical protein
MRPRDLGMLALLALAARPLGAQTNTHESGGWVDLGLNGVSGTFMVDAYAKRGALLLGARYGIFTLGCSGPCTAPYVRDASLLIGRDWLRGHFAVRAAAGPAYYAYREPAGAPMNVDVTSAGVGLAAHGAAEWVVAQWFALGIGVHTNVNGKRSVAGVVLGLTFGKRY